MNAKIRKCLQSIQCVCRWPTLRLFWRHEGFGRFHLHVGGRFSTIPCISCHRAKWTLPCRFSNLIYIGLYIFCHRATRTLHSRPFSSFSILHCTSCRRSIGKFLGHVYYCWRNCLRRRCRQPTRTCLNRSFSRFRNCLRSKYHPARSLSLLRIAYRRPRTPHRTLRLNVCKTHSHWLTRSPILPRRCRRWRGWVCPCPRPLLCSTCPRKWSHRSKFACLCRPWGCF